MQRILFAIVSLLFGVGAALAQSPIGNPPLPSSGPGLVDGTWLNGIAGGQNYSYKYGLTAVGSTQATALQLLPGFQMQEVDTADAGGASGVALPPCYRGNQIYLSNNTAYTINVFPSIAANPITAIQDVINVGSAATSTTITLYASKIFFCTKNGIWSVK